MLTVYGRSKVARSPKVRKMMGEASVSAQEDAVEEALGALAESLPHRHRSQVETLLLDPANGMAWLDGVVEVRPAVPAPARGSCRGMSPRAPC